MLPESKICQPFSYRPLIKPLCGLLLLTVLSSCSYTKEFTDPETCKIRTYTDMTLMDYLNSQDYWQKQSRLGIIPFDVPESFAPAGDDSLHFGRRLARLFRQEIQATGEMPITELFNIDRWPGKRDEFFAGNYRAIQLGREAGYSFVMVGYLEDIVDASSLRLYTKIVDTENGITVWSGRTTVRTNVRWWREELARTRVIQDRPDMFRFQERSEMLVECTVREMFDDL